MENFFFIFLYITLELVLSKQYLQNNCKIAKWCPEKISLVVNMSNYSGKKRLIKLCHRFSDLSFVKFEFFGFVIIKKNVGKFASFVTIYIFLVLSQF